MGILYGGSGTVYSSLAAAFTTLSGYSFLTFNLLCAPCFAAMGAIKREMNSAKWTWFAIGYQCIFAYVIALCVYQLGMLFTTGAFGIFYLDFDSPGCVDYLPPFPPVPREHATESTRSRITAPG